MASNKTAVVTGANNGIGFETALGMARAGYHTVLACRSAEKAEAAMAAMQKKVRKGTFEILIVDLGDFESIRKAASEFRQRHDHLDVLINNAGVLDYGGRTAANGYEVQFMTNHLGHMLLTSLLLDMMPDTPQSRIVSLSSVAHKNGAIRFDDIHCTKPDKPDTAYCQSKLACLLFGDELDRRLKAAGRKLVSLSVHPGGSDSGLFTDMPRAQYYTLKMLGPFITHSNKSAAQPALHAALSGTVKGGDYYGPQGLMELRGKVGEAKRAPQAQDADTAARLWTLSEEMIGEPFRLSAR